MRCRATRPERESTVSEQTQLAMRIVGRTEAVSNSDRQPRQASVWPSGVALNFVRAFETNARKSQTRKCLSLSVCGIKQVNSGRTGRGLPEVLAITNSLAKVVAVLADRRRRRRRFLATSSNSSNNGVEANSIRRCIRLFTRRDPDVSTTFTAGKINVEREEKSIFSVE